MTDGVATLRVASFNVRAAIGPGPFPDRWWRRVDPERMRAIAHAILQLDADIVALQEIALLSLNGEIVDNASALASETGYRVRLGATRHFPIEEDGELRGAGIFGNALLTRLPVGDAPTHELPQAPAEAFVEEPGSGLEYAGVRYSDAPVGVREPRCMLVCELDTPSGGSVTLASAHLSHRGAGERRLQADALCERLAEASSAVILAGDLNAPIESDELAPLRAAFMDAFDAAGVPPGDPLRTSADDGAAIDHIVVRGAGVRSCRVAREVGDLSDHWPVVADVEIAAARGSA